MKISRVLLIAAIACGLAVDSARGGNAGPAQSSDSNTQLVILRSPNIGYSTHFNIFVDGVRVANLGYGMKYKGAVTPGLHLITIKHMPHLDGAYPFSSNGSASFPAGLMCSLRPGDLADPESGSKGRKARSWAGSRWIGGLVGCFFEKKKRHFWAILAFPVGGQALSGCRILGHTRNQASTGGSL